MDGNFDRSRDRGGGSDAVLREENPKAFVENCPFPWVATHVKDLSSLETELERLGELLSSSELKGFARRLWKIKNGGWKPALPRDFFMETWGEWTPDEEMVYVIWKDPWMAVGPETFIASLLGFLGLRMAPLPPGKYPEIPESLLRTKLGFFSSEPFPFAKKTALARAVSPRGALVDGEALGWFGIRALRFLEKALSERS